MGIARSGFTLVSAAERSAAGIQSTFCSRRDGATKSAILSFNHGAILACGTDNIRLVAHFDANADVKLEGGNP